MIVYCSAIDWEHFMLGDDHYLVVSNAQNGGSEHERLTTIYRLQVNYIKDEYIILQFQIYLVHDNSDIRKACRHL